MCPSSTARQRSPRPADRPGSPSERLVRYLTRPLAGSALMAIVLTALLYGDALSLPLFSDDLLQIPWLESISWRELWTGPSPYGYYRPLWYSLWRVWGTLFGGLRPLTLHALNLIAHALAAWTVGALAVTWAGQERTPATRCLRACLATAFFAAFPFSRQAVAWPGAVYNPLVSAMAAGAILAYDRGRRCKAPAWHALALLLSAASALHYEAGLLVAPLVVASEVIGRVQNRWSQRRTRWPWAFIGLTLGLGALWRAMRGAGATSFGLTATDLRGNVAFLMQGASFPTAPLAEIAASLLELNSELALWLVVLPTVALLIWSGWRARATVLLSGAWFFLFALPPLIAMEARWFALAPRYLYTVAAAVALLWANASTRWITNFRGRWRILSVIVAVGLLLFPAACFVRRGMRLYQMVGESIWDVAEAAQSDPASLVVNLPLRITPRRRIYPLGFEGVTPLPDRIPQKQIARVNAGVSNSLEAVTFGVVAVDDPGYTHQLYGEPMDWDHLVGAIRRSGTTYRTRYTPERIYLQEAGNVMSAPPADDAPPLAWFGEHVILQSADCGWNEGGGLQLTSQWRISSTDRADVTVFAHLHDETGDVIDQADGYPMLGMVPFWLMKPGEVARDVRYFSARGSEEAYVTLGVWEPSTGRRLPIVGQADKSESGQQIRIDCPTSARP